MGEGKGGDPKTPTAQHFSRKVEAGKLPSQGNGTDDVSVFKIEAPWRRAGSTGLSASGWG